MWQEHCLIKFISSNWFVDSFHKLLSSNSKLLKKRIPDQHFGLWLGIECGTKSHKNVNFYMKWFCTIFCFFLHTRGYFSGLLRGCICTLVMQCVFSPPAWWCVYFHALQCNLCIFTHAWLCAYFLQFRWSVYSQAILKLFWCKAAFHIHRFIWRNKSSDLQKKKSKLQ